MPQKVRFAVWPRTGWRRAWRYVLYRVGRLPGTTYAIAGGFAWGAAMSFTPLIGFHIAFSMFGAWLTRCSVVAALIGTVVGNPWTFPFIWIWLYRAGVALGFGHADVDAASMNFSALFAEVMQASLKGDWGYLLEGALPLLTPMFVAAVPSAAIVWVTFFLLLKPVVSRYKNAANARRDRRIKAFVDHVGAKQESAT